MFARMDSGEAAPLSRSHADQLRSFVPYCFILDDTYHVVMAGPSTVGDPLADLYAMDSQPDVLPGPIDRVVRALTATWRSMEPLKSVSANVSDLNITVAPLHGHAGRRIAVFVQRGTDRSVD
ncbi:MAG: hypothetical protein ACYDGM_10230 [Vulcanimicrobiaceae bacterium]